MKTYLTPQTDVLEDIMKDALCGQQGSPSEGRTPVPGEGGEGGLGPFMPD